MVFDGIIYVPGKLLFKNYFLKIGYKEFCEVFILHRFILSFVLIIAGFQLGLENLKNMGGHFPVREF